MLFSYIRIAYRNLARQKVFSLINIFGLATGMACSMVILLWVQDELSYDRFHSAANQIYRITAEASDLQVAITPAPLGPALQNELPDVKQMARLFPIGSCLLEVGAHKFEEKRAFYADSNFLQLFDFELLKGNKATVLQQPNNILITKSLARKYFGDEDPLGKMIRKDNSEDFMVSGVLADVPANSHLQFDLLLPWSFLAKNDDNIKNNVWDNFDFYTYLNLGQPRTTTFIADFDRQIDKLYKTHVQNLKVNFHLQPLASIHLHSKFMADVQGHGSQQYVTIFIIIAIFILMVACINFMNLSTARSARRAKEVGLRKVSGATRLHLIGQFLGEAMMICFISLVLAVAMVYFSLPAVNNIIGKHLFINLHDQHLVLGFLVITIVTGLFSGSYPAFFLSGFVPAKVLKKDVKSGAGGVVFRNALVLVQFVISIVLLVGTTIVYNQLKYIQDKNLGFDKENLIYVNMQGGLFSKVNQLRASLQANPLTENYSISSNLPTNLVSGTVGVDWEGKEKDKQIIFAQVSVDENFLSIFKVEMVAGRNFYRDLRGDSGNFILNETAARIIGFDPEKAIGRSFNSWGQKKGRIIGVVRDFNFKPLHNAIEPLIVKPSWWGQIIIVKASPGKAPETIRALEKIWMDLNPEFPFAYNFVDQDLSNLYQNEKQIGTLFTGFAILAILISCLGLYGLSAFIAEQRTREIGVRKAMGASLASIVYLLTRKFVVLVLLAVLIATPLAFFAVERWLQGFAYHVSFNWLLVPVAGVVALVISLLTVSYESIKAARVNPVQSLRNE